MGVTACWEMEAISDSLINWESSFAIGISSSWDIVFRLSLDFIKISSSKLDISPTDLLLSNEPTKLERFWKERPRFDNFLESTYTKISSFAAPWISTPSVDPK